MKKLLLFVFGFLSFGFGLGGSALAQQIPVLDFFHGRECPHCQKEREWLPELEKMYPDLVINRYEVWHDPANATLMEQRLQALGLTPSGVPTNIIGGEVVVGFVPKNILALMEKHFGPPVVAGGEVEEVDDSWKQYLSKSWPMMALGLGIVDGFNPCAMWTLFVLLGFLLTLDDWKKRWLVGGVFLGVSAAMYFSVLTVYLLGFKQVSMWLTGAIMDSVFQGIGLLALVAGGMAVWHWRTAGLDCTVQDATQKKNFRDKMLAVLERESIWLVLAGVAALAITVNAIEFLCSVAIPVAFVGALEGMKLSFSTQMSAVSLYTVAYMFDDVVVFLIAMWTLSLKVFTPKMTQISHLVGGIFLILLGLIFLINPGLLALASV